MKKLILLGGSVSLLALVLAFGFSAQEATSSPGDINIHNIVKSFDPMNCETTISWDTDECTTTNLVRWGTSGCRTPSYPNTANSSGAGRSHSVTFGVAGAGIKVNFQIESSNACDTQTTSCAAATSGPCAGP